MARFFIDRPIFAWVLAIIVMVAGMIAILNLPVTQYPTIAPPTVTISAAYPGANAKTVEDSVTQVIEQNMNGLDHLLYISSTSNSDGSVAITLTFQAGTDPDIAQVQVQNKLQSALPLLPQEVQQLGVHVTKSGSAFLMVVGFTSSNKQLDKDDLSDYVASHIQDPISRLDGVGGVQLFGAPYSMRIWLNPDELYQYKLMPSDVIAAIRIQNNQVAAGQLGGTPAVKGQELNAPIVAQTRLNSAQQFSNIILKTNSDGSLVRLKDVAKVELAGANYNVIAKYNGKPATGLAVMLATGANALQTASRVKAEISKLQPYFPQGLEVMYPFDSTPFIKISIEGVFKTLFEAILLVFLVMYLFMQNIRATLIPAIAVPVVLLGTFAVLLACGFSINTLTMFAMVLSIGLLVDDAIVVVENVERIMKEEGLSPKEATYKSMGQIQGALVGIALVLSAVFIPMAFFPGSTGAIYRQFSVTIVSSMVLSVLVALILTPALCATILKPIEQHAELNKRGFFSWFNRMFEKSTTNYTNSVQRMLHNIGRYMLIYLVIVVAMGYLFLKLPTSFLPEEDQGVFMTMVQLPTGSTQQNTIRVLDKVTETLLTQEAKDIKSVFTVAGFSFVGNGQNTGMAFSSLADWSLRKNPKDHVNAILQRVNYALSKIKDGLIISFNLPAIIELGNAAGFDFELIDQGGVGHEKLMAARNQLLGMAAQYSYNPINNPNGVLMNVRPNGLEDAPEFKVNIDKEKALTLGLSLNDINQTLTSAMSTVYVNDFIDRGRVKKVYLSAEAPYRMLPSDISQWYVRGSTGQMVPFSAFMTTRWEYGSPQLQRYNGLPALNIQGEAAPGKSSGEAMATMEKLAAQLPPGIGYDWTNMSYQERLSGNQAPALYAISILFVFLCLAALYESWSIPFSVILVIPLGVIGALLATYLRGLDNDIYFKVGILTTIGLAAKNAILIVEFAKELMEKQGKKLIDATLEAVRIRLRPILMTSLAFMLGVLPLAINRGVGSGAQNAVGTGVMGGMLTATVLAIYFIPLFFVAIHHLFYRKAKEVSASPHK